MPNLLLLQLLNVTFPNTLKCVDEFQRIESIRVLVLQEHDHHTQISDFAEHILSDTYEQELKTFQIEEWYHGEDARITSDDSIATHIVITWDAATLNRFWKSNPELVTPVVRHKYNIFFVSEAPTPVAFFARFWNDSGVLKICFCQNGEHYVYRPFSPNADGTWGALGGHFRLRNFNGYPIKIAMFSRNPTSLLHWPELLRTNPLYANLPDGMLVGLDGSMVRTIAQYLNFTTRMVGEFCCENFGFVLRNRTITGTLGDVAFRRVDISTNGRFLMNYGTDKIDFTVPFGSDKICAVVAKSRKIPAWKVVFNILEPDAWLALYGCFLICTSFWSVLRLPQSVFQSFWEIYPIFHGVSIKIRPNTSQAFFLAFCLIHNLIILGIFQAAYYKSYTTPGFYKDIDTLDDLDRANISIASNFYDFDTDGSVLMASLKKKKTIATTGLFERIVFERNIASLQRYRDMLPFIKTHYLDQDGFPYLHMVDECLTSYFISYIVPKGSALLNIFNDVILRLFESGLTIKWYQDVEYSMFLGGNIKLDKCKKIWRPFSVADLQSPFFLCLVMFVVDVVVFAAEICFAKASRLKIVAIRPTQRSSSQDRSSQV